MRNDAVRFSVKQLTHITQLHKRKFTEALSYYSLTGKLDPKNDQTVDCKRSTNSCSQYNLTVIKSNSKTDSEDNNSQLYWGGNSD